MSQAAHPTVAMASFFDEEVAAALPEADQLKDGLIIDRVFSKEGENPFDSVEWHTRDAAIKNPKGEAIFEQKNVEFPTTWSLLASNVVTSKYFYGDLAKSSFDPDEGGRERSLRQLIHRVTRTIADWGLGQGYFATQDDAECFYDELTWLCVNQYGAFNSPVWFNVGLHHQYGVRDTGGKVIYGWDAEQQAVVEVDPYERPQASACFIISVEDSIDDIWQLMSESARLFKFGSGVGADWSTLRSSKEKLSGGGTPSGPVSFMRVQDATGGTIKSGGKTRRAAIMQTLKVWHPDILEFVEAKQEEERKAWALIEQGYDGSFNGPAYGSVAFQNVNQSVRVTDEFMEATEQEASFGLRSVLNDEVLEEVAAAHILHKMAEGTHVCGDPGVQYEDTIQRWHTCKTTAPIHSSNPCCFTGDTLVDTTAGQISFEDLYAMKDLPEAFGFSLPVRLTIARPIKRVWVAGETNRLAVVTTEQGLTLRSTIDHRYLTHDGEYVEARHLKPGTALRTVIRSSNTPDAVRQVNYGRVAAGMAAAENETLEEVIETAVEAASDHVASVEMITLDTPVKVYDMEVEDIHNFSVTAPGTLHAVVVHNSEYMFLDNSACNLASLNLRKFQHDDGRFDVERFRAASRIYITAMEILVDNAGYPSAEIAKNSHAYRPLGLGFANLGALLMAMGLPYDSDEGRAVAGAIMAVEHAEAYARSAEIAANPAIGPFEGFAENRASMLDVMQMHHDAVEAIHPSCPDYLVEAARDSMDRMLALGERHGYRNAQSTVLAPTGTIAFMMDCDTTGIEPDIALVKYKLLAGKGDGMLKIVNQTVPEALQHLGYGDDEIDAILAYVDENDTIEGAPNLQDEHLAVFDCAFKPFKGTRSIHHEGHIKMMAATQPFISGAISKTVNMPENATIDDIADAYAQGWKLGLKALAIYRENSKRSQPLSTSKDGNTKNKETVLDASGDGMVMGEPELAEKVVEKVVYKPVRKRLPDERPALTHKFSLAGHEGYLHVGLYPDTGMPGEIFITMAKQGSTISGLMDAFATSISIALQYGVPIEDLCSKFSYMRFEPSGFTNNRQIPMAKSIMDYIFRYLSLKFLGQPHENHEAPDPEQAVAKVVDQSGPAADETQMTLPFDSGGASVVEQTIASFLDKAEHAHATEASIHIEVDAKASFQNQADAPPCSNCGAITVRSGACYVCTQCGSSSGCG